MWLSIDALSLVVICSTSHCIIHLLFYVQSIWITPSRLSKYYRLKHLIHLYSTGLRLLPYTATSLCLSSQGRRCIRWRKAGECAKQREVKVSQTGNTVWSQVDNSVSIGSYRQSDAAPDRSACTRLSEQSPETQPESGGEIKRGSEGMETWGRRNKERKR